MSKREFFREMHPQKEVWDNVELVVEKRAIKIGADFFRCCYPKLAVDDLYPMLEGRV